MNRITAVFIIFALVVASLNLKLYEIITEGIADASVENSRRTQEIARSRGCIYDRNYNLLVNNNKHFVAAVCPGEENISLILQHREKAPDADEMKRLHSGKLSIISVDTPFESTSTAVCAERIERFADKQTAVHIIGQLTDGMSVGASGIEKSFDSFLSAAGGELTLSYSIDGGGRVLAGKGVKLNDNSYADSAGVVLTVDRTIQLICETALGSGKTERGAAVVLKADTAEIIASASVPVFNPNNIAAYTQDETAPFINRAFNGYSVGSVFKSVVAAAALESGIETEKKYTCTGSVRVGTVDFACHNRDGHGEIDMYDAMAHSCNCYFIQLAAEVGAKKILSMARILGFGEEIKLAEGFFSDAGNLAHEDEINSPQALANLSFGQGSLLATPLQIAAAYAAFANGGVYNEPWLTMSLTDKNFNTIAYFEPFVGRRAMSTETSQLIRAMLEYTVTDGSGKPAKPENITAAGKTATAQSGVYIDNKESVITWFAGFIPAYAPEYVIVVMKENGSSPSVDCAPVFKNISECLALLLDD